MYVSVSARATVTAGPSVTRTTAVPSGRWRCWLELVGGLSGPFAETELSGQAQVHRKLSGTVAKVAGNDRLSGQRVHVEDTVRRAHHAGLSEVRCPAGPIIEDRISVEILARTDVEWRPRTRRDQRAQHHSIRRFNRTSNEHPVTHIKSGPPVLSSETVLVRREASRAICVAIGTVPGVVTEHVEAAVDALIEISDDLLLTEETGGFVEVDIAAAERL